ISFRRELGSVLARVQRAEPGAAIPFELKQEHWPFFLRGFDLTVDTARLAVRVGPRPGESLATLASRDLRVHVDGTAIGGFAIDPRSGMAESDADGSAAL